MEIQCRSPQEIMDDSLVDAHTELTRALRMLDGTGRCLYTGSHAKRIAALRDRVVDVIETGKPWPHTFMPAYLAYHVIAGRA
jgi:hypothetical protein